MVPPVLEIGEYPAGAFHPEDTGDCEPGLRSLLSQLLRVMEKGVHEISRLSGRIPMLTVLQVLIDDLGELGVFQEPTAKAIQRGREAGYARREKDAARLEDTIRFPQRLKAIFSVRQMVQRSEKQGRIQRPCLPGERAGIANAGAGQRRFRLAAGSFFRQLNVQGRDIYQMDPVALPGQPAGVAARPAADIQKRG